MGFRSSWTEIYSLCSNFASHSTLHYLAKIKPPPFISRAKVNQEEFVSMYLHYSKGLGAKFQAFFEYQDIGCYIRMVSDTREIKFEYFCFLSELYCLCLCNYLNLFNISKTGLSFFFGFSVYCVYFQKNLNFTTFVNHQS